jgi:glycosyltransferase involved in cell wall biosynthesis
MPKITIIIPSYNSFDLINTCLTSLENQNFKDFEVIVVDDCSIDNTYEKLINYKKISNLKIKIFKNKQNVGPGLTRNNGIEKASGTYITFLDSDDYLEDNSLNLLSEMIEKNNQPDCIIFDYFLVSGRKKVACKSLTNSITGSISKRAAIIHSSGSTWCKVYKRDVITRNGIEFPGFKRNEDMPFNKLAIASCNSIYYCDKPLYNYVMNPGSLMHDHELLTEKNAIAAFELIRDKLSEQYKYEVEALFLKELLYTTVTTMIDKGYINIDLKDHIEYWEKVYPEWHMNPEIKYLSRFQKLCLNYIYSRNFIGLRLLVKIRRYAKIILKV